MPRLEMRTGKLAGKTFELSKAVILGRGDNVGIRVHDIKASREHCRVFVQAGKWVVVDLNSRNGITVNGAKTTRKELVSGDEIAIGETVLAYVDETAAAKPKAAPKQAGTPLPGEIVVDEIDLGGGDDAPARPAPAQRQAQRPAQQQARSAPSGKPRSAKDAAFAAARADAGRGGKKQSRSGGGGSDNDVGLNVSDKVLQFSKVDANKTSALSMDLSQYPVLVQIALVGGGLLAIGGGIWLLFKALGVTAG